MSIYLDLFIVFFKIGLLGFGGGYAIISMIAHEVVDRHSWLTVPEFTDIVAISQMTPGPIGINTATYVGYASTGSVIGSVIATLAVCLPSVGLMLLLSKFFFAAREYPFMKNLLKILNPVVIAFMAASVLLLLNKQNFIDYKSVIIGIVAFVLTWQTKLNPVWTIVGCGVLGFFIF